MAVKIRLDQLLVDRGLVESKTKAQALILSGNVLIGTQRADKAGAQVKDDIEITIKGQEHPWVSRGGQKLDHAIREFGVDVSGMTAIDVGASTGGFTDVLLHYGAAKVFAVDVGHGQLAWKLREHSQVVVMEKTNARNLTAELISDPIDLVVCDASFIGLEKVLPAALQLSVASCQSPEKRHLITLIKPQFEVGKDQVGKGGVVRDPELHAKVCSDVSAWLNSIGWRVQGITQSPITGPAGNVEFLLYAVYSR